MPVFMQAGCNTGSCHGAARGKDGFRLSLFGFDPDGDHYRLTREINGRRINLALPAESLLLEKADRQGAAHRRQALQGRRRVLPDAHPLARRRRPARPADRRHAGRRWKSIPKRRCSTARARRSSSTVRAKYSDGTDRDVTSLALFLTQQRQLGRRSTPDGIVTAGERGEAFVMARFATFTVGSPVHRAAQGAAVRIRRNVPENNYIDTLVHAKLKKLRIAPSELCTDEAFLRRVYLDIVGMLPTAEEYDALHDRHRRRTSASKLVDELLGRKEFAELWVHEVGRAAADPLVATRSATRRCSSTTTGCRTRSPATCRSTRWCRSCSAPTAARSRTRRPTTTRSRRDTLKVDRERRPGLHGHAHPVRPVPQPSVRPLDDGRLLRLRRVLLARSAARAPTTRARSIVFNSGGGEVTHPVGGRVDAAEVPRRRRARRRRQGPPRGAGQLARLAGESVLRHATSPTSSGRTSSASASSTRSTTSASATRPSNPELLDELGKKFTEYNYDFKKLVRDICTSRTYQLSTQPNATQRRATRATSPTPASAASGPRCCSTASAR